MTMRSPRSRSPARHLIVLCLALVSSSESFHISSLSLGVRLVTNRIDNSCVRRAALGSSDEETPELSRRDALSSTGGALASLLIGSSLSFGEVLPALAGTPPDYGTEKRTVVLTGANSGIGYDAATRLASRGHRVVLACRTQAKAEDTASRIRSELGRDDADVIPLECDLSSIASIDSFVRALKLSIEGGIDSLCLNAGLARNTEAKDVLRTKEGFELTVGTNHLGHFYLNHLLLSKVKKQTGRIVITASGVHDPDSPGGAQGMKATLGNLAGLEAGPDFEMVDGGSFNADKAYKDSKLCNVFFTRELQRRLENSGTGITANCFNPGLIVSTGLFRDQNQVFTKVFDIAATSLIKVGETPHWGGGSLEYMALDKAKVGKNGGLFYSAPPGSVKYGDAAFGDQFASAEVSKEARNDAKGRRLWELSEKLLGIKTA